MTYLIEYLGEFEFIFETILDYESGDQMGSFDAKKPPSKISCLGTFKSIAWEVFMWVIFLGDYGHEFQEQRPTMVHPLKKTWQAGIPQLAMCVTGAQNKTTWKNKFLFHSTCGAVLCIEIWHGFLS